MVQVRRIQPPEESHYTSAGQLIVPAINGEFKQQFSCDDIRVARATSSGTS